MINSKIVYKKLKKDLFSIHSKAFDYEFRADNMSYEWK